MITFRLASVPMPHRVAEMVLAAMPEPVGQAVMETEDALREIGRFRPLASADDRIDFEAELGRLAARNKILAACHPRFAVSPWGRAA
ncbi:hypothetical protein [Streptomyces filamentosus]|uniref:Uncharacterized protein n=1 Tax=Streptomyces filamentosus TaxID=67294 RepID=A0A919BXR9_STRFL|nr:hypothetical protein [Streptomyces filamentosus]GHG30928.1 hypothetical protein GCM10017667_80580 [Streptomyces filamentosus]GHG31952.1 hypothetical protein GCM10017667_82340 [Streptomyces filamentosus]